MRSALLKCRSTLVAAERECEGALAEKEELCGSLLRREPLVSVSARLGSFPRVADGLAAPMRSLEDKIVASESLAESVSGVVRHLDETQRRVKSALSLADETRRLRACCAGAREALEAGDLSRAASLCRDARALEEDAALLAAAPADVEAMRVVFEAVSRAVKASLDGAEEDGEVLRLSLLLGQLGQQTLGLDRYLSFAERQLPRVLGPLSDFTADLTDPHACLSFPAHARLSQLFNAAASLVTRSLARVTESFRDIRGGRRLLEAVEKQVFARASLAIEAFSAGRGLAEAAAAAPRRAEGAPESHMPSEAETQRLEQVLNDCALVLQSCEAFERFLNHSYEGERERSGPDAEEPRRPLLLEPVVLLAQEYSQLEALQMHCAAAAALLKEKNSAPSAAAGAGSGAEEAFYALRRSLRRALATGDASAATACVNHACAVLQQRLLATYEALARRSPPPPPALLVEVSNACGAGKGAAALQAQLAARFQRGVASVSSATSALSGRMGLSLGLGASQSPQRPRGGAEAAGPEASADRRAQEIALPLVDGLRALETLRVCERYCEGLRREAARRTLDAFEAGPRGLGLRSSVAAMRQCSLAFRAAREAGVRHVAAGMKAALRNIVAAGLEAAGDEGAPLVSYRMAESDFQDADAADVWVYRTCAALDTLLAPYKAALAGENHATLLYLLAGYLAKRLEAALARQAFTAWGALQLDRELRTLGLFLQHLAHYEDDSEDEDGDAAADSKAPRRVDERAVKGRLARLGQMAQLLSLQEPREALDLYEPPRPQADGARPQRWQLSKEDVKAVLRLRVDFSDAAVDAVRLG